MLKKINLNNYGKFKKDSFEFGLFTIFCGDNEAGKTTLYDALFESLCDVSGTAKEMKQIKKRYGRESQVEVKFENDKAELSSLSSQTKLMPEGCKMSFNLSEFINLYSIRSNEVSLDMKSDSDWMEKVKARLFSGGIDPHKIIFKLDTLSSEKGSLKHNKDLKKLINKKDKLIKGLDTLQNKRKSILNDERSLNGLKKTIKDIEAQIEGVDKKVKEIDAEKILQEKIVHRKKLDSLLGNLGEYHGVCAKQKVLDIFKEDKKDDLKVLDDDISVLKGSIEKATTALDLQQKSETEALKFKSDLETKKTTEKQTTETANLLLEKIAKFKADLPIKIETHWRWSFVGAGISIFLLSLIIAFFFSLSGTPKLATLIIGVVSCLLMIFVSKKTTKNIDDQALSDFLTDLKNEWKQTCGENDKIKNKNIDELMMFFAEKKGSFNDWSSAFEKSTKTLAEKTALVNETKERIRELTDKLGLSKTKKENWLKKMNVKDRDEYIENISQYKNNEKRIKTLETALKTDMQTLDCESYKDLQRLCDRTLREYDSEGVSNKGLNEIQFNKLKKDLKREREFLKALREKRTHLTNELNQKDGKVKGSLGDLPEQILDLEGEIFELNQNIADTEMVRTSAGIAKEIFKEIAGDADTQLQGLADEFVKMYSKMIDTERPVGITHLKTESIKLTDAGGTKRKLEHLSKGTRDSFIFAARLALARKATDKKAILILDDPFITYDQKRQQGALKLLNEFQKETGWQVVLLTKDNHILTLVNNIFPAESIKEYSL